jgi:hypothetical protein
MEKQFESDLEEAWDCQTCGDVGYLAIEGREDVEPCPIRIADAIVVLLIKETSSSTEKNCWKGYYPPEEQERRRGRGEREGKRKMEIAVR